ncbi:hypothetical protein AUK04_03085 [Candidatus Roizmanbacteria bacterium CG2_30_33_16]|uniref:Uncharacterized protein n=3 Tax=Candidatus Roizmaniibacteriota TaxID=1752723 RepID=A0A2M7M185_9BACT|nr:hypothetical protein [Candidatus Roizmanbacteria bacterium]OIP83735.1 MAG: hypothetical protein AUK04_03085 [Candidatus Roizmanbacteria bacterium CG2_30_33_16]PIX74578.1 MAG: hypothetical protein COZ39_00185 [Candidatus Roizmanbacteria bacterium CG_4_10_14_3_um_filter_33_21]PJB87665.1 MAG: hypothetical protein CO083_05840 [Candidatus Roizmanbacteria bacterium CG_4_9_14_0_8_um_filter_34_12]
MDLNSFFNNKELLNLFIKAFAVVFSIIYLLFSIVLAKQADIMTKTVDTQKKPLIILVSLGQVGLGVGLLIYSLFL